MTHVVIVIIASDIQTKKSRSGFPFSPICASVIPSITENIKIFELNKVLDDNEKQIPGP